MLKIATAKITLIMPLPRIATTPMRQQDAGKREQHVADAHHRCGPTSPRSSRRAGPAACRSMAPIATETKPGRERDARAHQDAAEDVAAERVDAEPVRGRRAGIELVVVEEVLGVVGHDPRRNDRDRHQQQHEHQRAQRHVLLRNLRQNSVHGVRTRPVRSAITVAPARHLYRMVGLIIAIQHVDDQIDQDEFEREQQHQRLDDRDSRACRPRRPAGARGRAS